MDKEQVWKELVEKFPFIGNGEYELLYVFVPGDDVPVDVRHVRAKDIDQDRKFIRSMEDIPLAYAVVSTPNAIAQTVVEAKWEHKGWDSNPWNTRHLIRHLVDEIKKLQSIGFDSVADLVAAYRAARTCPHCEDMIGTPSGTCTCGWLPRLYPRQDGGKHDDSPDVSR